MKDREIRAGRTKDIGALLKIFVLALCLMMLAGCAPALYSVDMKYVPSRVMPRIEGTGQIITVTVTAFEDQRKIEDKMLIGWVVESDGRRIPVLPKFVKPSMAVTSPLKDFLVRAGYRISPETPAWDLKEGSIRKEWGSIVIGGSIDELEVICRDSLTVKKYSAKAKITALFANAQTGKIFYKVTTQSAVSLDHVLFSEERIEQQINAALSDAIEKLFEGKEIAAKIREAAAGKK
ncbi:MAG: hypothetical protein A4E73_02206 [Syntrophaceae bacterium PtaU1.Bin231]|nr:MAG: hypothetical protein A4E73_02206 [Syntrophaceae bacterium PtaU1.Bin231]HOG16621.1 hypothetical protein [Syntrophales bacterium]